MTGDLALGPARYGKEPGARVVRSAPRVAKMTYFSDTYVMFLNNVERLPCNLSVTNFTKDVQPQSLRVAQDHVYSETVARPAYPTRRYSACDRR